MTQPHPNNVGNLEKRDISFTINDGTNGIKNAIVTVDGKSCTNGTGSAGGCTIKGVTDGTYTITVTAEGYQTLTQTITIDKDNTSFIISLTAE